MPLGVTYRPLYSPSRAEHQNTEQKDQTLDHPVLERRGVQWSSMSFLDCHQC